MAENNRIPRRILHTSDWHLASPGDRACQSMEVMATLIADTRADMVIIAGDLFDTTDVGNSLVRFAVEQLGQLPAEVVILPGNHDCLSAESALAKAALWNSAENIRIVRSPDGETLDYPDLGLSLWGKSIDSAEGDFRPLAGMPQPHKNGWWHILVAHGYYYTSTGVPLFLHITPEEIIGSGWDYIALGHLADFRCVCEEPLAYYSGSLSLTGMMALVDLDDEAGIKVSPCFL